MTYPTKRKAAAGSARRKKSGRAVPDRKSRAIPAQPPQIFVRTGGSSAHRFHRAHLRNRKGYVYLSWRDGEKVRTFYLGKAPRKSPTPAGSAAAAQLAGAGELLERPRRRKTT